MAGLLALAIIYTARAWTREIWACISRACCASAGHKYDRTPQPETGRVLLAPMLTRRAFLATLSCGGGVALAARRSNRASTEPDFDVGDYGARGDGTDETVQIQRAIDATLLKPGTRTIGAGTIRFGRGKTYLVDRLHLPVGITLDLNGATLKRIPAPAGESAENVTKHRRTLSVYWSSDDDSPLLTVRDGVMHGNRGAQGDFTRHRLEQAHLLHLAADRHKAGRLCVRVDNMLFRDGPADGISMADNVDMQLSNSRFRACWRAGFTLTGSNSRVQATNLRVENTIVDQGGIDLEADPSSDPGFRRGRNVLLLNNVDVAGGFDLAPGPESVVLCTNVNVREPIFYINGAGSQLRFQNCNFAIGAFDDDHNRVVSPGDCTFESCTFTLTEVREAGEGNREFAAIRLFWNVGAEGVLNQNLRLVDCVWRSTADLEGADTLYGVYVLPQTAASGNTLTVVNPEIPRGFDFGLYLVQGSTLRLHGGHIAASTVLRWSVVPAAGHQVDVTIDGLDVRGARRYAEIGNSDPGSVIRHRNVVLDEAEAAYVNAGADINSNVWSGARVILVNASPVGRIGGIKGDIARIKSPPITGGVLEWVCTVGNDTGGLATWEPLKTVGT